MKISFDNHANNAFYLCHPWHAFEMIKLTGKMRQKNDQPYEDVPLLEAGD